MRPVYLFHGLLLLVALSIAVPTVLKPLSSYFCPATLVHIFSHVVSCMNVILLQARLLA